MESSLQSIERLIINKMMHIRKHKARLRFHGEDSVTGMNSKRIIGQLQEEIKKLKDEKENYHS